MRKPNMKKPLLLALATSFFSSLGCGSDYLNYLNYLNRTECESNNGVWQKWSRLDYALDRDSCNIRASDSGRECYNSTECEGECLFDYSDANHNSVRGSCSEFRQVFDCFSVVDNGIVYGICVD